MAVNVKLPRLLQGWRDQPKLLERYWDIAMSKIEEILNQLLAIPAIEAALADLDAAVANADAAAQAAQDAADTANGAANSVTAESSIVASFPTNFVAPLISADNLGEITIANHSRQYGDTSLNPTVAVTGAVLSTGQPVGAVVRVYYSDPTRAGGAVTYQYTVDPADPPVQGGDTHSVGAVTIPAGAPAPGGPVRPPGYVSDI